MQARHEELTPCGALRALLHDQAQYPIQPPVQAALLPLAVPGLRAREAPSRAGRPPGLLVRAPGRPERFLSCRAAAALIARTLRRRRPGTRRLAALCGRAFLLGASLRNKGRGSRRGPPSILVRTGMESYRCVRCGLCCTGLDMHDQCRPSDLARWRGQDRQDILERTGPLDGRFVLWTLPGAPLLDEDCPWLTPAEPGTPGGRPANCAIHGTKPGICRDYPGSYKHAAMTGCPAFLSPAALERLRLPRVP